MDVALNVFTYFFGVAVGVFATYRVRKPDIALRKEIADLKNKLSRTTQKRKPDGKFQ